MVSDERKTRRRRLALLALALLVGVFLLGPRVHVGKEGPPRPLPALAELSGWIAAREANVPALRPGLARAVLWADPARRERTPFSIVYLHGFSASPRELSPVPEELGAALHANVFLQRLTGHGQDSERIAEASARDWLDDAAEAVAIGRLLGERVIVLGMSTGGTLATWAAMQARDLHALVLLSPNFGLTQRAAQLMLWPWGRQFLHLMLGQYSEFKPATPLQEARWTTRYRSDALLQMMAVVGVADALDLSELRTPTLVLYAEQDAVIDVGRIRARFAELGGQPKQLIAVPGAKHVLCGDAVAPKLNAQVKEAILGFLSKLR